VASKNDDLLKLAKDVKLVLERPEYKGDLILAYLWRKAVEAINDGDGESSPEVARG
jgi:hypothetical protein